MSDEVKHWRSLEHRASTPEFSAAAREEFPGFENVYEGLGEAEITEEPTLDRRKFLAASTAALGLAGLAGCRRPDLKIVPFSAIPDEQIGQVVLGKPAFYATCLPRPGGALPILVESHEGRPTKIEGNPAHLASRGSTDAFAQAAIFDMYSPDRVMAEKSSCVSEKGAPRKWDDFDRFLRSESARFLKEELKGKGLYILAEEMNSPSVRLIRQHMKSVLPEARWHTYEPVDMNEVRRGAELAFGSKLTVRYNLDRAGRILALDSDFLGLDTDQIHHSHGFMARRKPEAMNRFYAVESNYSITGTMADHRLRLPPSQVGFWLVMLGIELLANHRGRLKHPLEGLKLSAAAAVDPRWVQVVAKDLADHAGSSAIIVGPRQPAVVHALAHALNSALGNIEAGVVEFRDPTPEANDRTIGDLVKDIDGGKVETLLVIGGNPVINAPADLKFKATLQKVSKRIRLGLFFDHTSEACDWHLPLAHSLEGWGDAEAADGTLCCIQPLIAPLNGEPATDSMSDEMAPPRGGRTVLEVLALLTQFAFPGSDPKTSPPAASYFIAKAQAYELVRKAFSDRSGIALTDTTFEREFSRYKQLGFLPADKDKAIRKAKPVAELKLAAASIAATLAKAEFKPPSKDALELAFAPSYSVYDGRFTMNPWLQELPDPITKLVWDNAAIISPKSAAEFNLATGDIVQLTSLANSIEIAVYVLPGHADWCITLPFGHSGDMRIAHVPDGGGTNVFPLRTSQSMHSVAGCTLTKTGGRADLVTTQEHGVIPDGRDIIREVDTNRDEVRSENGDERKGFQAGYGNPRQQRSPVRDKQERFPLDLARPELLDSQFQWGMVIDLNSCTGCSACLIACQAENNIPVVGKQEVKRNRELHWIRIDRYFTGGTDEPRIVAQPLACVHCEQAPCEEVCPVNAAVHSPEGLNLQVYNRCIGTRYCANACPYKVRRFNWFDFNKRQLDELRTPTPFASGGASLTHNLMPESLKMQKNPDVTVRMRGVMEKCTYCVQRLEKAKFGAKIAATEVAQGRKAIAADDAFKSAGPASAYRKPKDPRAAGYDLDPQGRVIVPDGMVNAACAEACPTQAITFGNVLDSTSRVAKLKERQGEYLLLGELNTKPRTSYLPRLRNPNPEL
jgi:MoCo/4Fe-4S cofactor protein with predicted Tat translocation signal